MSRFKGGKSAFTLVEILIAVVLLGILAAIVLPRFAESAEVAEHSAAKATLHRVRLHFELCKTKRDCDCNSTIEDILDTLFITGYLQARPAMPGAYTLEFDGLTCRVFAAGPELNGDNPASW